MKNVRFFANVVKTVAACVVMGLSFVSCQKDEIADHSNKEEGKAKLIIDEKPGPQPVLSDSTYGIVRNDTLILRHDSLKNDTLFKRDSLAFAFNASISREFDERKTTVERLKKLDFSFNEAENKQNGKMEYYGAQTGNDLDGQNYTVDFKSGKGSLGSIVNAHFELVGTDNTGVKSTEIEKKASDSIRVNSEMSWNIAYRIANVPNLAGKSFRKDINQTNHERYISYGDAVLVKRDTTMTPTYGIWSTEWLLKVVETYRVNGKDSIAPQTKKVTLVSTCGIDKNEDAFVGSLDFNHSFNSEKWSNWYSVESADKSVSIEERKFERLGVGSNGIEKDKFNTRSFVTEQKATVVFAGLTWNIPATNATLTNVRHTFLEEASDLDGYSMLKFVDDEMASYANATEGNNYKKLNSSCKLYMKVATPDVDKIEFAGTKVHTNGMAKIDGSVIPVYTDGTKGAAIKFKWEKAESWQWLKDSVIAEGVTFVNQTTGELKLKGSESKAEKTFATDNKDITIKCNQYDADFQTTVKVDGQTKVTTWHATWYEDFKVVYSGKEVSLTKSSYSVKNQNDKLSKDEAKSSATSEWWNYSVDGIFNIDEDSRSAMGYGRLTKTIDERVVKTYWDEASKGQSHTVLESTRWATLIREYNTGKKTSQEYKHVFNRLSGSSKWEITAEEGSEAANGSMILENANEENRADDFAHFSLKKFELGQFFNVPGAAQQHDKVTFTESMGAYFEAKDQDGNAIKVYFEDPSYSFTNDVKALTVKSENDSETVYQHENVVNWNFGGATTTLSATGLIHVAKSQETPDFDIEVGSIYASVSRPSNRNASDITAYTYLLVSKDGKKCLPLGIYNNIVTVGEITSMQEGFNSACYVKDQNKVVATRAYSDSGLGMMIWCGADGNPVDAASHITLQGAGFNDRGNDWVNHTGKYAPRATKKGNVTVVTFEGTNVSYTFRGWNV